MKNMIIAGIVTYNPQIDRLEKNINSILNQVQNLLIVDNGSSNIVAILECINNFKNIDLICNKNNMGIAFALNQIGDYALEKRSTAFLTLDQDSVVDNDFITKLSPVLNDEKTGMVCPYINQNNDFCPTSVKNEVQVAITSRSIVKTKVWQETGGFWDFLFIDEVDHEFSYQVRNKGYKIIQSHSVSISHIIGAPLTKRVLWHTFHPSNHSAFRRYYMARNSLIIKHLYPDEKQPFPHRTRRLLNICISILLCEKNKCEKLKAILSGVRDGLKWNRGNKFIKERRCGETKKFTGNKNDK